MNLTVRYKLQVFSGPARITTLGRPRVLRRDGRLFGQLSLGHLSFQNRDQPRESASLYYFRAFGCKPSRAIRREGDVMNSQMDSGH